jgi:hypothetical protein
MRRPFSLTSMALVLVTSVLGSPTYGQARKRPVRVAPPKDVALSPRQIAVRVSGSPVLIVT